MANVVEVDHRWCGITPGCATGQLRPPSLIRCDVLPCYWRRRRRLAAERRQLQTPLTSAGGFRVGVRVGLVPILRAGLGLVDPILVAPQKPSLAPGRLSRRGSATIRSILQGLPPSNPVSIGAVLDPMLATVVRSPRRWRRAAAVGGANHQSAGAIAAPEGIKRSQRSFPRPPFTSAPLTHTSTSMASSSPA